MALLAAMMLLAGCRGGQSPGGAADPRDRDVWEVVVMDGSRVGYAHTAIRHVQRDGAVVRRIDGQNRMTVKRFNHATTEEIRFSSAETLEGRLLEFSSEIHAGPQPLRTVARFQGPQLELVTTSAGKETSHAIPWRDDFGGPYALESSLARQPLQPGQRRAVKALVPGFNEVVTHELEARQFEPVALMGRTATLLRVEVVLRFSKGQSLAQTIWVDGEGAVHKTHVEMLKIDSFRVSQAEALKQNAAGPADLTASLAVPLASPLKLGHQAKTIRYRLTLEGKNPAEVFRPGPSQEIRAADGQSAELVVRALRPDAAHAPSAVDAPGEGDREANNLVQSDDPTVVALAAEAAGDETDAWKLATRLEQFVHRAITRKDFSQAFATAAEVARTREGDCTEHAVLLAALARARGVPARVAIGLVYLAGSHSFAYHMWNELYVDGRWIPLDATLAQGGIGAAHLKLATSDLKGASAFSAFLPVVEVIGRLKIEVLEEQ